MQPDEYSLFGRRIRQADMLSGISDMLNPSLVIARKETIDGLRDTRSVISSLMYTLLGPVVVGLVSLSPAIREASQSPLAGLMSVFTLVAAFAGGMNVAMDTVAGERERRSLLPLLLNPIRRWDVILGKWLAVSLFAVAGLMLNLLGFSVVFVTSGMHLTAPWPRLLVAVVFGILTLPLLAASLQLLLSTACRSVKEAQTYLSMLVLLPMGVGMFLVFAPAARRAWLNFLPLVGQQLHLQSLMDGRAVLFRQSVVLGCLTLALAMLVLLVVANRLQRDESIYGN
jgi:sodium transport system permease protein